MFALKSKGTSKVPDFVQIRDDNFALIEHIKLSLLTKRMSDFFPDTYKKIVEQIINEEFDKIIKIS